MPTLDSSTDVPRKPDLICIGAQKAGTSWLFTMLNEHPDVWTPPFKELHYFDHHYVDPPFTWTKWHVKTAVKKCLHNYISSNPINDINLQYVRYLNDIGVRQLFSEKWYERIFEKASKDQCAFEATPEYSTISQEGVDYIKSAFPDTKFIYMIRHPVERALSQVRMKIDRSNMTVSSRKIWLDLVKSPEVLQRGKYSDYVPRWRRAFGPDKLLLLPYSLIKDDPHELLDRVESFAGLTRYNYYKTHLRVHATKSARPHADAVKYLESSLKQEIQFYETLVDEMGWK